MNLRRGAVIALVVWLVVVVAGASLVWAVISRAGQGVGTGADPVVDAGAGAVSTPRPSSRPSEPAAGSPTGDPSATQGPPPSTSAPPPELARRTWRGEAGFVSVKCRGASIELVGAVPDSGYSADEDDADEDDDDSDPDRVRVDFESRGEDERRIRVEAVCSGGQPEFAVDVD